MSTLSDKQSEEKKQEQDALELIQLSNDELISFLQQKALGNPLMEVKINKEFDDRAGVERPVMYHPEKDDTDDMASMLEQIPEEMPTLDTFLLEQIHLTMRDTPLRDLVIFLVDFINPEGYATIDLHKAAEMNQVEDIQMLDALTLLQQLDPPGVGARNLQECLLLQTERDEQSPEVAYYILESFFEELTNKDWSGIAEKTGITVEEVKAVFHYAQTLNPKPGSSYSENISVYDRPDLYLQEADGKNIVKYNELGSPYIVFQKEYYEDMMELEDDDVRIFLDEKKAEWEIIRKGMHERKEILVKVAEALVETQADFFAHQGDLNPVDMDALAVRLNKPSEYIRMAVQNKKIETERGTFPLLFLCGEL